jgi:hypothetical protein
MKKTNNLEALAVPRAESPKSPLKESGEPERIGKVTFGKKQSPANKFTLLKLAEDISSMQN